MLEANEISRINVTVVIIFQNSLEELLTSLRVLHYSQTVSNKPLLPNRLLLTYLTYFHPQSDENMPIFVGAEFKAWNDFQN